MTGKELILYILENNLEDVEIIKDGGFAGFLSIEEVAAKFNVGVATVETWQNLGMINGFRLGTRLYFPKNVVVKQQ